MMHYLIKSSQTYNEGIKFKNHNLITYESNKQSTSCFDDKQYIQENGIDTLACGHKNVDNKITINWMRKLKNNNNHFCLI